MGAGSLTVHRGFTAIVTAIPWQLALVLGNIVGLASMCAAVYIRTHGGSKHMSAAPTETCHLPLSTLL
jgi:hypothetical protein